MSDTADSFGGATRERRLEIMRDSRIGSFGASALVLAFALRIGALADIAGRSTALDAMLAVAIAASLSRTAASDAAVLPAPRPLRRRRSRGRAAGPGGLLVRRCPRGRPAHGRLAS